MSNARLELGLEEHGNQSGLGVHEEKVAKDGETVFIAVDVRRKMRGAGRNAEN